MKMLLLFTELGFRVDSNGDVFADNLGSLSPGGMYRASVKGHSEIFGEDEVNITIHTGEFDSSTVNLECRIHVAKDDKDFLSTIS